MRGGVNSCCFMLRTLWTQIRSRSPKHQMNGFTLLPTYKRGGVTFTNWTTQADGVDYPTALYLHMEHKEANTRLIVSQLAASQLRQMNMTLQYFHMEGGFFLPRGGEGERRGCGEGENFWRRSSSMGWCARESISWNQSRMPVWEATKEVSHDTTRYKIEGLLFFMCDTPLSGIRSDNGFRIILR